MCLGLAALFPRERLPRVPFNNLLWYSFAYHQQLIISFHFISFHFISFPFLSFPFVSFRFVSFRFISFHFLSFPFLSFGFVSFRFVSFRFVSFRFISFHFISFHFISFHFISFHFISFHFISFHFISFHRHHLIIIIIIISPSSSSSHHHHHLSPLSLSLAFLFFSILAQPSSHEKRARCNPSQGKCMSRGKKGEKVRVFCDFQCFGLCGNPAVQCQKLRVFCDFFWSGAPLSGKTRVECHKLMVFCDFGVPKFVLRIVLTTRFATYAPFLKKAQMNEKRQKTSKTEGFWRFFNVQSNPLRRSGLGVSKTEGFWPFLHARTCPNDLFCYIRPSPRLSRGAPKWFQRGLRGV